MRHIFPRLSIVLPALSIFHFEFYHFLFSFSYPCSQYINFEFLIIISSFSLFPILDFADVQLVLFDFFFTLDFRLRRLSTLSFCLPFVFGV